MGSNYCIHKWTFSMYKKNDCNTHCKVRAVFLLELLYDSYIYCM